METWDFEGTIDKMIEEQCEKINNMVIKIITEYAGMSLEEAKKHECTCVYSKPSLEGQTFLGLIIDGTFYDCLGNKTDAKIFHPS